MKLKEIKILKIHKLKKYKTNNLEKYPILTNSKLNTKSYSNSSLTNCLNIFD